MDDLPRGWSTSQLSELVVNNGICTDGDWVESKDQDSEGNIRLIQLADIGDGIFLDKSSKFLNDESGKRLNITKLRRDDILLARMPHPLGRACIFPSVTYEACTVVDVLIFRSGSNDISNKCLMHFINSPQIRRKIELLSGGSTRKRISGGNLKSLSIPIPPKLEQERISKKVDDLLSKGERAVREIKAVSKLITTYKASVFKKYLLGGFLDAKAKENTTPISIGLPSSKLKNGWNWVKLSDVAKLESGHTPKKSNPIYWSDGDIPWISLKDIRAHDQKVIFETSEKPNQDGIDNSSARLLPEGTVVFSRDISVGFVTIMGKKMATSQHFANWVCGPEINNFYLKYALASARSYLIKSGQGTTVKTIYMPALKEFYIALPSIKEQIEVVKIIQDSFKRADLILSFSQSCEEQISKLNRSVLAKAFNGKICRQNPNDEPASDLLKRIAIQRKELLKLNSAKKKAAPKKPVRKTLKMITSVVSALSEAKKALSSQQLLFASGYPINADTELMEQFFLDVRQALIDRKIEIWREGNEDHFRLVE
ncbi:restriction endonuclease subunit S [Pseudophaeobacter sp.]|uniref:restriction endonuclease subunit S n=1 Tax=Pseudophaeobacter sp. TaxID=1971739 RepID=UPI0032971B0E